MNVLRVDNPAIKEMRTIHPKMVLNPLKYTILKSAADNSKLGKGHSVFTKSRWKGLPLYSLTLEERKTCPSSCELLRECYGRNMPFSNRFKHGINLQNKLTKELTKLSIKYPNGFVVRLHVLGDFYSVPYVKFWNNALIKFPNLNIFGYTARLDGPIHNEIVNTIKNHKNRFAIRFSDGKAYDKSKALFRYAAQDSSGVKGIICPEQTGKTNSCLTCGLCFQINDTIRFIQH